MAFHQSKYAGVGGGVSESTHGALNKCRAQASVETYHSAFLVQCFQRLGGGQPVAVLVVDGGAQPHEGKHV